MDIIKKYYRLCAIKLPDDQPNNIYNQISVSAIGAIFTKKEVEMFLDATGTKYKIKETVIGGKTAVNEGGHGGSYSGSSRDNHIYVI